ncbi:hypothetical protein [Microlunatus ginsengisoli]|uniref:ParB-like nuclease domain-containing protein n=1 Tax=Microlunatus ginsengisoli TaxID=363863 RepID=A0ABP7AYP6_9ACTN
MIDSTTGRMIPDQQALSRAAAQRYARLSAVAEGRGRPVGTVCRRRAARPGRGALLSFDQAARTLRVTNRSYVGVRPIPVSMIVGSVGRSQDLDRHFRWRHGLSSSRLESLRDAFPDGDVPAIQVFQLGEAYFIQDGHHRVALAIERRAEFIDAQVTLLETSYEVGPDVDVCGLVQTEQQRSLLESSGLSVARPEARIVFTLLEGYTEASDVIKAYGYELAQARGFLPSPEVVAANWYDELYLPAVRAARRAGLPELYSSWGSTDGDLFLWLYQIRRDLRSLDGAADFTAAARRARELHLGWRRKRDHLRRGGRPLPSRGSGTPTAHAVDSW